MDEKLPIFDAAGETDAGTIRKGEANQDFFQIHVPSKQRTALFIVADGMGGMQGGAVASKAASATIIQQVDATEQADPEGRLRAALEAANVHLREEAARLGVRRIGSTLAGLLLLPENQALVFNVGDSRVYQARGNQIEQLSRDQSVMAEQLASGLITEEEAKVRPNKDVLAFLGQDTPILAEYRMASIQKGDHFILCSDGLWEVVEPHEMLEIVNRMDARSAARHFIRLTLERGGPDNVTVIVVNIGIRPPARLRPLWAAGIGLLLISLLASLFLLVPAFGERQAPPTTTSRPLTLITSETPIAIIAVITIPPSLTPVRTETPTPIPTTTPSPTPTPTPTFTPSSTSTPTRTPTATQTATSTRTPSPTSTPTATATFSPTPSPTLTSTETATSTQTPTFTPTATATPSVTFTPSFTPTPTGIPTLETTLLYYFIPCSEIRVGIIQVPIGRPITYLQEYRYVSGETWIFVSVTIEGRTFQGWLLNSVLETGVAPTPLPSPTPTPVPTVTRFPSPTAPMPAALPILITPSPTPTPALSLTPQATEAVESTPTPHLIRRPSQ